MRLDKSIKGLEPNVSHYEKLVLSCKNTGDSASLKEGMSWGCGLFFNRPYIIRDIQTSGMSQGSLDLGASTSQVWHLYDTSVCPSLSAQTSGSWSSQWTKEGFGLLVAASHWKIQWEKQKAWYKQKQYVVNFKIKINHKHFIGPIPY